MDFRPSLDSARPLPVAGPAPRPDAPPVCEADTFRELIDRLWTGDDGAAEKVWNRYAVPLIAEASRHLDRRLQRRISPESVVQEAFASLFRRAKGGAIDQPASWTQLWCLLVTITLRKCANGAKFHLRQRRDASAEASPAALDAFAAGRDPTPEDHAMLAELQQVALRDLSEEYRQAVELSLLGGAPEDVAVALRCPMKTVQRALRRFRANLLQLTSTND